MLEREGWPYLPDIDAGIAETSVADEHEVDVLQRAAAVAAYTSAAALASAAALPWACRSRRHQVGKNQEEVAATPWY